MKQGWRKVIIFTEALLAFCIVVIMLQLRESSVILATGTAVSMLLGAAIYGNVQEYKSKQSSVPQS